MSEIVTIEPPQDRAVTLEEARQQLRLDGRDEDLLVGAKLDCALGAGNFEHNSFSTSDAQTGRNGDFFIAIVERPSPLWFKITGSARQHTIVPLKTALQWLFLVAMHTNMPLTSHIGMITTCL